jgi:ferredoxin
VFKEGEDGTTVIVEEYQDGSPPLGKGSDGLLECINRAAIACPLTGIIITKE